MSLWRERGGIGRTKIITVLFLDQRAVLWQDCLFSPDLKKPIPTSQARLNSCPTQEHSIPVNAGMITG